MLITSQNQGNPNNYLYFMVKYISADSTALIQGLTTNIATAKSVTGQLKSGSQHLIQSVDGEHLSGAAYTARKGYSKT